MKLFQDKLNIMYVQQKCYNILFHLYQLFSMLNKNKAWEITLCFFQDICQLGENNNNGINNYDNDS